MYGGAFGVSDGLVPGFGEARVRDTPISEEAIVGLGVGAAMTGLRPIVEIQFSDFIVQAMDQIVNQAAKLHFMYGGKARCRWWSGRPAAREPEPRPSIRQSLEAWFAHVPGLKVVLPATPQDAFGLLLASVLRPQPGDLAGAQAALQDRGTGRDPVEDRGHSRPDRRGCGGSTGLRSHDRRLLDHDRPGAGGGRAAGRGRHRGRGRRPPHGPAARHRHGPGIGPPHRPAAGEPRSPDARRRRCRGRGRCRRVGRARLPPRSGAPGLRARRPDGRTPRSSNGRRSLRSTTSSTQPRSCSKS